MTLLETAQDEVLAARAALAGRCARLEDLLDELPNSLEPDAIKRCDSAISLVIVKAELLRLALRGLSQAGVA